MSLSPKPRELRSRSIQLAGSERQILRLRDVESITALARSTIFRLIERQEFPKPIRLSLRAVGWRAADIEKFLEGRPEVGAEPAASPDKESGNA